MLYEIKINFKLTDEKDGTICTKRKKKKCICTEIDNIID